MSFDEGEALAKQYNIFFIETSAKTGLNIKSLFRKVASALPGIDPDDQVAKTVNIDIGKESDSNGDSGSCTC